ncbi:hypothetical protein [Catenuloplanes indicus]|uniref:Uncharacterized protein n=1 Tax=Catenuloplanes indicus TaxID=137267 RepID=A0AAE3VUV0_9ACTN|nr:hypothetical protein [Catenuloplanes indicus]MDQ0364236.1 hypothetical protein [Catenuloplanes indicus]
MRIRKQMRGNRHHAPRAGSAAPHTAPAATHAELAAVHTELTAMRAELAAVRAELAALRAAVTASGPAGDEAGTGGDDIVDRYLAWRSGPLVRIGKALARRSGTPASGDQPVRWRGAAMRTLCQVLLAPSIDAADRHRLVGDAVTDLLGDTGWRNDADLIRALIEVRDTAAPLAGTVRADEWDWPAPGTPITRHEPLPGSDGTHVALVVAPGLRTAPPLVVAG